MGLGRLAGLGWGHSRWGDDGDKVGTWATSSREKPFRKGGDCSELDLLDPL